MQVSIDGITEYFSYNKCLSVDMLAHYIHISTDNRTNCEISLYIKMHLSPTCSIGYKCSQLNKCILNLNYYILYYIIYFHVIVNNTQLTVQKHYIQFTLRPKYIISKYIIFFFTRDLV